MRHVFQKVSFLFFPSRQFCIFSLFDIVLLQRCSWSAQHHGEEEKDSIVFLDITTFSTSSLSCSINRQNKLGRRCLIHYLNFISLCCYQVISCLVSTIRHGDDSVCKCVGVPHNDLSVLGSSDASKILSSTSCASLSTLL
jgi:hypothetical protein